MLYLGCGTATLTILIKKNYPETQVVGIDGDHEILKISRTKIEKADVNIALNYGMIFELPYLDDSFDHVVSSLVFHHLTRENKIRSLKEAFRMLKPHGELHILNFGKPQNLLMYLISLKMRRLEENIDNSKGLLPEMIRMVGFDQVEETARFSTSFGTVASYGARKPGTLVLPSELSLEKESYQLVARIVPDLSSHNATISTDCPPVFFSSVVCHIGMPAGLS